MVTVVTREPRHQCASNPNFTTVEQAGSKICRTSSPGQVARDFHVPSSMAGRHLSIMQLKPQTKQQKNPRSPQKINHRDHFRINGPFWEMVLFEPRPLPSKTKEKDKAQLCTGLPAAGPAALGVRAVHFHQISLRCPAMAAGSAAASQNTGRCQRCAERSGMS